MNKPNTNHQKETEIPHAQTTNKSDTNYIPKLRNHCRIMYNKYGEPLNNEVGIRDQSQMNPKQTTKNHVEKIMNQ